MSNPIRSDLHYQDHTGVLTNVMTQPTEDLILTRNAELRKNPGVIRDLGAQSEGGTWGRQVASIPFIRFDRAIRDGYQLNNPEASVRASECARYLRSEEGKKCLVQG
jgi:hypothetical protein